MAEPSWEELLGQNNWDNLIDPLDLSLRKLVLRAGDFCQATYDTFINDENSIYCGASRYGKPSFFHKVMLDDAKHYEVITFLYATARVSDHEAFFLSSMSRESWDRETNWIGYIAITTDERSAEIGRREIYVVFRGTTRNYEWINVMGAKLSPIKELLRDGKDGPEVMLGWFTIYTTSNAKSPFTKLSARQQLLTKIKGLLRIYKDEKPSIILTGHSLGASIATVAAFDLAENITSSYDDAPPPVTAIVFGSPRVGNREFLDRINGHSNVKILHVKNEIDLITRYPAKIMGYVNIGTKLKINTGVSPSLKDSHHPGDWHNLQAMLHIVAGWNGKDGKYELKVYRDIALVNKSCALLKDECLIPECWWVEKNKGMRKREDGDWVMATPDEEDLPAIEFDV